MLNTKLYLNNDLFTLEVEKKATRTGFGDALVAASAKNDAIVVLTGNLGESVKLKGFLESYPDRYIDVGVAEQNMTGIAAGLAVSGKVPIIASYAEFVAGRNWEQIRIAIALTNANVKIVGSHAGLSACYDGATAQCLEDIALMRVLPRMTVLSPCDYYETTKAIKVALDYKGPVYIRLSREDTPVITSEKTPFEIGRAYTLVEGTDITLLATGPIVYEALLAAKELRGKHKIHAEVINCPTVKPLDEEAIIKSVKKTGKAIALEDHQVAGGFGGAVAELLSERWPVKLIRIGARDRFGESGRYQELKDKYGLSAHQIYTKALELIND